MKLFLFDIDGTLLRVSRSGAQIVRDVLTEAVGRPIVTEGVRFSGRTDQPIIRDVMLASGLGHEETNARLGDVVEAYRAEALSMLRVAPVEVLPGVRDLLALLAGRDDVVLGLLTGNIEDVAYAKLEAVGLAHYFDFGAFGSDRDDRYELPPIALERALSATGLEFTGKDVVIVGDTEHDILCGRSIGVYAVAVATGHFDRAFLLQHDPDLLLDDLTQSGRLFEAVFLA